jgi:hypothetical protein
MHKLFLSIFFYLVLINSVFADNLKFQCEGFKVDVINSTLINNGNGKKAFRINNEVKWYMVTNLQGIPIVVTNTLNINNSEWTRKSAGESLKKRPFKELVKKLRNNNKKITNYQKKKMLDQELFVVSNYGTIDQEFEKYLLIDEVIGKTSDSKKWDKKCSKI